MSVASKTLANMSSKGPAQVVNHKNSSGALAGSARHLKYRRPTVVVPRTKTEETKDDRSDDTTGKSWELPSVPEIPKEIKDLIWNGVVNSTSEETVSSMISKVETAIEYEIPAVLKDYAKDLANAVKEKYAYVEGKSRASRIVQERVCTRARAGNPGDQSADSAITNLLREADGNAFLCALSQGRGNSRDVVQCAQRRNQTVESNSYGRIESRAA